MRYLLDTHALLWLLMGTNKISKTVRQIYSDENNTIFVSTITLWEMAIKISIGKLRLNEPLAVFVDNHIKGNNISLLSTSADDIFPLETLPYHHRDPFDRALIAQGMSRNLPIISKDETFDAYPVKRVW